MATTTISGTGTVSSADFKYVKWVGKTKSGAAVSIIMPKAMCISNIDLAMAEKDDVVPEIEFEGVYSDTDLAAGTLTEPWTITYDSTLAAGNDEILLGAGAFYVGAATPGTLVGLTRGGGSFSVEREYREINADGDPGKVEGRVTQTSGRPKLKLKALQWVTKMADLYSGLSEATA